MGLHDYLHLKKKNSYIFALITCVNVNIDTTTLNMLKNDLYLISSVYFAAFLPNMIAPAPGQRSDPQQPITLLERTCC